MNLAATTAVVTGSSSGIGLAELQPKTFMQPGELAQLIVSLLQLPDGMLPDEMTVRPL